MDTTRNKVEEFKGVPPLPPLMCWPFLIGQSSDAGVEPCQSFLSLLSTQSWLHWPIGIFWKWTSIKMIRKDQQLWLIKMAWDLGKAGGLIGWGRRTDMSQQMQ